MLELAREECNGCGACYNACPMNCITMVPDERGFLYPNIDTAVCISCGACEAACPPLTPLMTLTSESTVYLTCYDHEGFLEPAAGGAIFAMLARYVIEKGGTVFGASFSPDMELRHRSATELNDIFKLQGVKLSQSDTKHTMREARDLLNDGKWVLYAGTPCQIEGFLAFLGREYETLITIDFVCSGVSSPRLLAYYLEGLYKDYGEPVVSLRVREKYKGYKEPYVKIFCKPSVKIFELAQRNSYVQLYEKGYGYRPSCRSCQFRKPHHLSDFTISDAWSAVDDSFAVDNRGLTIVQLNTEQGDAVWKTCLDIVEDNRRLLRAVPYDLEKEKAVNVGFTSDKQVDEDTEEALFNDLKTKRFRKAVKAYIEEPKKSFWSRLLGR